MADAAATVVAAENIVGAIIVKTLTAIVRLHFRHVITDLATDHTTAKILMQNAIVLAKILIGLAAIFSHNLNRPANQIAAASTFQFHAVWFTLWQVICSAKNVAIKKTPEKFRCFFVVLTKTFYVV